MAAILEEAHVKIGREVCGLEHVGVVGPEALHGRDVPARQQVIEGLAPRARTYHTHTPHTSRIIRAAPPTAAPLPHAPYPQAHLAERVPVLVLVVLGEKDAEGCGEGMLGRVRGGRRARRRVVGPATAGRAAVLTPSSSAISISPPRLWVLVRSAGAALSRALHCGRAWG